LFYESVLARKSGQLNSGRELANKAIHHLRIAGDDIHMIQAYLELSRGYDLNSPSQVKEMKNVFNGLFKIVPISIKRDQREVCMMELLHFYNNNMGSDGYEIQLYYLHHFVRACQIQKNRTDEFWARKEIADIHHKQGKHETAIAELLQIAKEQKEGGHPRLCFTYDLLSAVYHATARYDKALHYSLETIKYVKTSLDSVFLPNFYARIASNYSETGSVSQAVEWNMKMVNYRIATKPRGTIFGPVDDIASDLIRLGRPKEALRFVLEKNKRFTPAPTSGSMEERSRLFALARCYQAVNDDAQAEKYCKELLKFTDLRIRRQEITSDYVVDLFVASFYLKTRKYNKAEQYFKRAMQQWPKTYPLKDEANKSDFLFKLDSGRGNYLAAIKHLQRSQLIRDSMFTEAKSKLVEELKIVYETEKKDQLIHLNEQNIQLLTKQDLLQKSKLRQEAYLRNIGFAAAILLIIILALLYNRYRLKQKTNRKLESQQREIAEQNHSLQHLLTEKEWLLKEIHHRVKNNLQIVMSLLNSQSAYIDNPYALTAIHDSQHRVHAMSLIHQKLYGSDNLSSINMSVYVRELVTYLSDSFDTGQRIRFECNIEPLEIDVSQAVPLGLILNEAITNSIKYAFPDGRSGVVSISLSATTPGHYLLRISDDGIGMPSQGNNRKSGSLGMSLMQGLSEDLNGNFTIENDRGTTINISFADDRKVKRPHTLTASFVSSN
jgi:two-component sensor histidine kinase